MYDINDQKHRYFTKRGQGGRRSSDWAGHWECGLVDGHLDFHPNTKHQMSSHCPWTNLHTAISHRLMSACLNSPSRAVNDLTWPSFCNMLLKWLPTYFFHQYSHLLYSVILRIACNMEERLRLLQSYRAGRCG